MSKIIEEPKKRKPIVDIKKYSKEHWIIQFLPLIGKHKKILLVSDFINKVGGIETYIHDVKELLESHGFEVKIRGRYLPKGILGKIKKLFGIGWGLFNIVDSFRLWKFCRRRNPDILRYHSTLRWLGWMPVWIGKFCAKERWMMYHDLGYFFPFPKKLLYEQQVKTPLTLFSFLSMVQSVHPPVFLAAFGKYISLAHLKKALSTVDKHLVPSPFLVNILHESHNIPKKKIFCLEHFLQE